MNHFYIGRFLITSMFVLAIGVAESSAGGKGGGSGPSYRIVELDNASGAVQNGVAYDINNVREVVGYVEDAVGGTGGYAAHWSVVTAGGQTYSSLTVLGRGVASGINDASEIVGQFKDTNGDRIGAYWRDAQAAPIELPPLPGHDISYAFAINNDGVVCGTSGIRAANQPHAVAWRVYWSDGMPNVAGPVELPGPVDGSRAFSLNDTSGGVTEVAGEFQATQTGVIWQVLTQTDGSLAVAPVPELLDTGTPALGLSTLGINNAGVVCGHRDHDAVVWSGNATITLNRPTKGKAAISFTAAYDISNTGVIVGIGSPNGLDNRAVVWQNSSATMLYLDSFLDANSPLLGLSEPWGVNDHGEIVGRGWAGAFIAIPK